MSVIWDFYTGWPKTLMAQLNISVAKYCVHNSYVKVGITNDPNRRWLEHYSNDPEWEKMVVLYKTERLESVRDAERSLIDNTWKYDSCWNDRGGGGGNFGEEGPYYLYALLQK